MASIDAWLMDNDCGQTKAGPKKRNEKRRKEWDGSFQTKVCQITSESKNFTNCSNKRSWLMSIKLKQFESALNSKLTLDVKCRPFCLIQKLISAKAINAIESDPLSSSWSQLGANRYGHYFICCTNVDQLCVCMRDTGRSKAEKAQVFANKCIRLQFNFISYTKAPFCHA